MSPHNIILDCIETPSNRPIILKLREEFQRSNDNPEIDRFISLIFSKLTTWKLMTLALDIKKRSTSGVMAQRIMIKLLETISELSWHAKVCIISNRKFFINSDWLQFLTSRSQLYQKRETLTRNRGMRNYILERYSSTLSPSGNIFLISTMNGYLESPHFAEMPLYGET